jgi:FlaA1/EpsC-like NDP-sugar epimerase
METLPEDFFTTSFQFTEHIYRDVYPSIEPTNAKLSQAGKVVVITGATGGISRAVCSRSLTHDSR